MASLDQQRFDAPLSGRSWDTLAMGIHYAGAQTIKRFPDATLSNILLSALSAAVVSCLLPNPGPGDVARLHEQLEHTVRQWHEEQTHTTPTP